jgi:hypothetical protein
MRYGNGYQEEQKEQAGILNPGGYGYQKPAGPAQGGNVGGTVQKPGFQRQPDYQLMNENTQTEAPAQQPVQEAPPAAQMPQAGGTAPAVDVNQQLDALYAQIMNRPGFQFDLNGDALYQQLVDSYTNQGRMAMMDTMGQAATLTGGYGNSYAQGVGQQAYHDYIQGITDQIPDLYNMALNRYIMEGDAMYDQLAALQWQAEFEEDKRRYDQAWEQEYGTPTGGNGGGGSSSGGDGDSGVNSGGNDDLYITDEELYAGMSEAGKNFMKNVPYLHAGGDVEGWKRTVAGMLYRALENGTLTEEDAILITIQLGLEDIVPDDKDYTKPEEEKKNTGSTGGGGGGHRYEMKPWGP